MTDMLKILFVEDDADTRDLVADALLTSPLAVQVEFSATIREAQDRLCDGGITCILLDLGLPDASGLSGVRALRSSFPWLPIVVVSALDSLDTAESCITLGVQDYVVKRDLAKRLPWAVHLALARQKALLGNGVPARVSRKVVKLREDFARHTADLAAVGD